MLRSGEVRTHGFDERTPMPEGEPARRFWTAHGRSRAHMTVLYALATNPRLSWTPFGISTWYGVPIDDVIRVFGEFVRADLVTVDAGMADGIRWNRDLDWAIPTTKRVRRIVQDRWLAITDHPHTQPHTRARTRRDRYPTPDVTDVVDDAGAEPASPTTRQA